MMGEAKRHQPPRYSATGTMGAAMRLVDHRNAQAAYHAGLPPPGRERSRQTERRKDFLTAKAEKKRQVWAAVLDALKASRVSAAE